ncbi:MAG: tRNA dihydrouridine synthase DusB [Calditrichaeota bacterium]|nr:tRNA dihydrouridine synthase DusB [Calditrichota bacterium]
MAPLAGWTDQVFRLICKDFGAGLLFTEMTSADGLVREQVKTLEYVRFSDKERPIGVQLFGAEPDILAEAARRVARYEPDLIDLNFGCPAKKVVKRGAGSALLKNMQLTGQVAKAVVAATEIPVTAKIRSGWDKNVAVDVSRILEDAGIAGLIVHPRTQKMLFNGQADWEIIADVKNAVSIPVIGNGDIKTAFDAKQMMEQTGCDMVMVGRAVCGNPWILSQINDYVQFGIKPQEPSSVERLQVCTRHFQAAIEKYGAQRATHLMRKQIAAYIKGMPKATELRRNIFSLDDAGQVLDTLQNYMLQPEIMLPS